MSGIDELLRGLDSIPPSLKLRVHIPPDASFHPIGHYCQKAAALIRELASTVVDVADYPDGTSASVTVGDLMSRIERLEQEKHALSVNLQDKAAYLKYVGDALGQDEERETVWDAAQRVLSDRDRLREKIIAHEKLTLDERHWLSIRTGVIEALHERGLEIMSDRSCVLICPTTR